MKFTSLLTKPGTLEPKRESDSNFEKEITMNCITAKMPVFARCLAMIALISAAGFTGHGTALAQDNVSRTAPGQASNLSEFNFQSEAPEAASIVPPGELPASQLTAISNGGGVIHAFPTIHAKESIKPMSDYGPLIYHSGGAVMGPSITVYPIFWVPARLQNGRSTGMSTHYQAVQYNMLKDYAGHGLGSMTTQYFQKSGTTTTYVQNKGGLDSKGTYFVDTAPYPSSGCQDPATPGNCLTDAQIRAEVQKVVNYAKLTGGLDKIFMLFTSSGEGSCFDSSSQQCAYTHYCAYHSTYKNTATPVIYANEPYGDVNNCQAAGVPSPNHDPYADAAATSASHELTEAITDPLLNAWFTSQGNEIGDICAYDYGSPDWAYGYANEMWNGHYYMLQTEYSNHSQSCLSVGP